MMAVTEAGGGGTVTFIETSYCRVYIIRIFIMALKLKLIKRGK